jgi:hypothetical protein
MNRPWPLRLLHGLTIFAIGWLLALCFAHSQAGVNIIWVLVRIYGGAAILLSWLVLLATSPTVRGVRLSLRLAPAAAVILAMLLSVPPPPWNPLFRVRFELSRSSFAAAAEHCRKHSICEPSRIGLFPVKRSYAMRDQVRFLTTSCEFLDYCGVVYSPSVIPSQGEDRYTSLGGGWYHIRDSF